MKHTLSLFCAFTLFAGAARADTTAFDAQMRPIAEWYLAIHAQLANDSLTDVTKNAQAIKLAAAKLDPTTVTGEHAARFAKLPARMQNAATLVEASKDLAQARLTFKALSQTLVLWATLSKPAGYSVMYCSMAKGAWLQKDPAVRNPYYGPSMLTCGEIVDGAGKGTASGHMKAGAPGQ